MLFNLKKGTRYEPGAVIKLLSSIFPIHFYKLSVWLYPIIFKQSKLINLISDLNNSTPVLIDLETRYSRTIMTVDNSRLTTFIYRLVDLHPFPLLVILFLIVNTSTIWLYLCLFTNFVFSFRLKSVAIGLTFQNPIVLLVMLNLIPGCCFSKHWTNKIQLFRYLHLMFLFLR